MLQTQQQQRDVSTHDADGVAVKRVARRGSRRKRSVEKQDCRRSERRKNKWSVGNHCHPGEDGYGDESIDEHEQRPDSALRKAVQKVDKPQPPGDAANNLGVEQRQPRRILRARPSQALFRVEIQFTAHGQIAQKRNPLPSALTEIFVKPAAVSLAVSVEGSTGTRVSQICRRRISGLSVLSTPANTPPDRTTRHISAKSLSWRSTDATW